tara:strand:+ start:111 stop:416 length:306 start_codon:yes stop_codon:yes gene_type:complete
MISPIFIIYNVLARTKITLSFELNETFLKKLRRRRVELNINLKFNAVKQDNEIILDIKLEFRCLGFGLSFHVEHELEDETKSFTGITLMFLFVQVKFGVLN